tara:strand:- start:82 stop:894 length:813 start_codon:yes stop_codon:yes gene_type:complete
MEKITEANSLYNNLENMTTTELLYNINTEDRKVSDVIKGEIPNISKLSDVIFQRITNNGRLFYIGSGTSGRLGILDASECPPTFGVSKNIIMGIIAGGNKAIREAIESAEDNNEQAWEDLKQYNITEKDIVIGISASGTTPYVVGGLKKCQENNIYTGSITCNQSTIINNYSNVAIKLLVGPEFITGSTRMKAGSAQKMTLNMLSTSVMIKLGHVVGNKMIDMKISNSKLKNRGIEMIINQCKVSKEKAISLLESNGNVRKSIKKFNETK